MNNENKQTNVEDSFFPASAVTVTKVETVPSCDGFEHHPEIFCG
jgi:hypothetical protein